jgi:CRP-like cAMP-binding protein
MRESEYLEGNTQLVEMLKDLPDFKYFEKEQLEKLIRFCKLRSYATGEFIIEEGNTDKFVYLLISGGVKITKNDKLIVQFRKVGDLFGEMGFLAENPRSASVVANEDTSCLAFDGEYLDQIDGEGKLEFQASIYRTFAQILANRLRITTQEHIKTGQELEALKRRSA